VKAAVVRAYGPPESISIEEVADPVAGPGQVVVEVRAASVNFPDVLLMRNQYQVSLPPPFVPGSEFAGVVRSVGDGVEGFRPGSLVLGASMVGAFAQAVALSSASLIAIPDGASFEQAAAFWVTYSTAYHALRTVADLQPGEWVAVLGAAGGVGLATIDVARALGGRVIAAASSDEKLDVCRARGAEATVNYAKEDLKTVLRLRTEGGPGVVVDPVGGPYSEQALRATRWGGRFVVVGFATGEIPRIPLNLVLLKGVIVRGFEMRTFAEHLPAEAARDRQELLDLFGAGRLEPYVSASLPLEDAGEALRRVADREAIGKVVITP
jgi:NADPH2:quinone reductase